MNEPIRRTLLGTKVIDIEVKENTTTFYLENQHGVVYSVEIKSGKSSTILLDEEAEPKAAQPETVRGILIDLGAIGGDVTSTVIQCSKCMCVNIQEGKSCVNCGAEITQENNAIF